MTEVRLLLDGGGSAVITESDGAFVTLQASRAFPPGATLVGRERDGAADFRVKVRGSARDPSAAEALPFTVRGRFVNLSREQRLRLVST